ncbi:MAG: FixH family protein [Clostridium sp.]|uniref:FixH family protein n=1 Tax=Clostridium sp. TaxID=1506 RepID=UPI0025B88567|nr:FixH family protein [Clostridium sp.]MCE5220555.1 FixH family protein [Clostridium sp.]
MKKKTIRGAILSLVLTLGLSTAAFAAGMGDMDMGQGTEKSSNGINAELTFNKDNKVKTGKNDVMVTLHDNNDKEIQNADVKISAEMDKSSDMGGMNMDKLKPIEAALESSGNGQYMGNIDFTDKGKWTVTANVLVNGEKKDIKFDVDVASAGPNWIVIGGFVGIVAVIIVVAAVKKKSSK